MDSPLGKSLLGKRLDDEITVTLPSGAQTFTVVAITYPAAPAGPEDGGQGAPS
jgi:transcription elongation factor GreB